MGDQNDFVGSSKSLCYVCIGEHYLRSIVKAKYSEGQCSYCSEVNPMIPLEELVDRVELSFQEHFKRTSSEPNSMQYAMLKDKESTYDWEREGQKSIYAIMDAAEISETVAKDIQEVLSERHFDFDSAALGDEAEFSDEAHYEEIMPGDEEWQMGWSDFEKTIKSESRFFSRKAADQLCKIFESIDEMATARGDSPIVNAGPNTEYTHLYRARVFQSDQMLKRAMARPDKELAAPPSLKAAGGRMNATGISTFYGATKLSTALAEVRPPVGSQIASARFKITRPLRLLDLASLADILEVGSIFDPDFAYRIGRAKFLRRLCRLIERPIMPDDQSSEYLVTQAIADFLATEAQTQLDGILYSSAQVSEDGLNAILFHKASRCCLLYTSPSPRDRG